MTERLSYLRQHRRNGRSQRRFSMVSVSTASILTIQIASRTFRRFASIQDIHRIACPSSVSTDLSAHLICSQSLIPSVRYTTVRKGKHLSGTFGRNSLVPSHAGTRLPIAVIQGHRALPLWPARISVILFSALNSRESRASKLLRNGAACIHLSSE